MSQPSAPSVSDADAWAVLVDPLSVRDRLRLGWLRSRMDAVCLLSEYGLQDGDHAFARRLAFARYLVQTGRLTDEVSVSLESLKAEIA